MKTYFHGLKKQVERLNEYLGRPGERLERWMSLAGRGRRIVPKIGTVPMILIIFPVAKQIRIL
jgi:hypothetical protein